MAWRAAAVRTAWAVRAAAVAWMATGCAPAPCELPSEGTLGELTAWEQAWLDTPRVPDLPDPAYVEAEDGLALAVRTWEVADPAHVVVLLHGSSAHGELYEPMATMLRDRGLAVVVPDTRGHGLSTCDLDSCGAEVDRSPADDGSTWPGRAGDAADANQPVRDLARHVEAAQQRWPDAAVHLMGHSSGGGLVSRFVELTGAVGVRSVVLLAPYNHPDQPQVRDAVQLDCPQVAGTEYARLDLGALGDALRGNDHRYVLRFVKDAELTTPLDTLAYTWTMTQGLAATDPVAFWRTYDLPVVLIAGAEDHLLLPGRSEAQVARAAQGSFVLVDDTSHIGLIWSEEVADHVAGWVSAR